MGVQSYESVFIFKPELTDDEIETSIQKIEGIISNNNGKVIKIERWGKKRLSYDIKRNKQGFYILIQHESESERLSELRNIYQLIEDILRYQVIRLDGGEKIKQNTIINDQDIS